MKQTQDKARNLTMMMDEYELTMANAYFNDPTIDKKTKVSFDVFYRVNLCRFAADKGLPFKYAFF